MSSKVICSLSPVASLTLFSCWCRCSDVISVQEAVQMDGIKHCHDNSHAQEDREREKKVARKRLYVVSVICLVFMIGEIIGQSTWFFSSASFNPRFLLFSISTFHTREIFSSRFSLWHLIMNLICYWSDTWYLWSWCFLFTPDLSSLYISFHFSSSSSPPLPFPPPSVPLFPQAFITYFSTVYFFSLLKQSDETFQ